MVEKVIVHRPNEYNCHIGDYYDCDNTRIVRLFVYVANATNHVDNSHCVA